MPYKDKNKQRECQKRHYLANKDKYLNNVKRIREERIVWFRELKSQYKCGACGFDDCRCLDFHHIDPDDKKIGICEMVKWGYAEETVLTEIKKCEVLCANCHVKQHWSPKAKYHRNPVTNNIEWLRKYKSELSCQDCGLKNHEILVFHHLGDKIDSVSNMVHKGCSISRLLEEIEKCEVLCHNCHRIKHNGMIWV